MDHTSVGERDFELDLESGGTTSEEDGGKDHSFGVIGQEKNFLACGFRSFGRSNKCKGGVSSRNSFWNPCEISTEKLGSFTEKKTREEMEDILDKKLVEKHKKENSKQPSKPPLPPRGPSLDDADRKLVREITELAMLKRARVERTKKLKKMKAVKASSSRSNLCAMVITILFFLAMLFQGLCSRSV